MGLFAGTSARNLGWGRTLAYAGRAILQARFGGGHYSSVASHTERWRVFASWARTQAGIRDLRAIPPELLVQYADHLKAEGRAVSTIQNRLSTVNVILDYAREGHWEPVSPRALSGAARSAVRTQPPRALDAGRVEAARTALQQAGLHRAAAVLGLARTFGLRSEEAAKADLDRLAKEAARLGRINILDGTKGGRTVPRWVAVTPAGQQALQAALAARPPGSVNLLAPTESYKGWRQGELRAGRALLQAQGLPGYHDARAAYACERYRELTGHPAPAVTGGRRTAERDTDRTARAIIARELGHGRVDIAAAYVGSAR
ncbi:integrase domain-containing protein [Thiohalocapsa marina]|nr:integrase domain-containing protein [Thiohalocapsa marina]